MKRRTFIYLSLLSATAVGVPFVNCRNRNGTLNKSLSQPTFLSHISDAKTLREIGTAYRKNFPSEAKEDKLAELLTTNSSGRPLLQTSDQSLTALLDQKIKQDFETSKTVVVRGWVLSDTEARQCALFSLS
jgi:hypothetical protein